ncbi:MAG: hypothetical protein MUE69_22920 [Myxococcota bacterium]|jgi:hypothetical protein|nr:hypothetical protein [Myxococcota bacterium]
MAEDLGARLVRAGLATREQLAIALADGAQSGGALAAGLVDAGVPEEDLVAFFLGEGHGPEAAADRLRSTTPERLPAAVATAFYALPIGSSDRGIEVAMADPSDTHALGELAVVLGAPVLPRPARISALREALSHAFPHTPTRPPAPTPLELVRRKPVHANRGDVPLPLSRPKVMQSFPKPREPIAPPRVELSTIDSVSSTVGSLATPKPKPVEAFRDPPRETADYETPRDIASAPTPPPTPRSILSAHEASWGDLAAPDPVASAPAVANRRTLPEIGATLASLRSSRDRDAIVRLACEAASTVARTTVFLTLRKGVLRGWEGTGAVSPDALRNLWIPASSPSVFQRVIEAGEPHRGPHGTTAADKLFRAATGSRGSVLVVEPIRVGDRVVAVLCADDPRFGPAGIERLEALAHAVGTALERVIVEAKR